MTDPTNEIITDSCQACYLHREHNRCTGENTLGTKKCACRESGHEKYNAAPKEAA
jgi:hypothetical protein